MVMNEVQPLHEHLPPAQRDARNWDAIKIRYEVLGEDLSTLAREYNIVESFLLRLADSEGWKRQELPEILNAVEGSDPVKVLETAKARVELVQIYKELALLPSLLEIESSLVSSLKKALTTDKKHSPKDMKFLVDSFTALTSRQKIMNNDAPVSTVPKVEVNIDTGLGGTDVN